MDRDGQQLLRCPQATRVDADLKEEVETKEASAGVEGKHGRVTHSDLVAGLLPLPLWEATPPLYPLDEHHVILRVPSGHGGSGRI